MKKAILSFLSAAVLSFGATSQTFPYEHTVLDGTYENLMDPSVVSTDPLWDDFDFTVELGFNFNLFGQTISYITIADPGIQLYSEGKTITLVTPLYGDVCNADTLNLVSTVGYITEGAPGNRIFKVEWKNVGFYAERNLFGTFNNRLNLQVWLYENGNVIEFRYGPYNLPNPELLNEFGGQTLFFAANIPMDGSQSGDLWNISGDVMAPNITWSELANVNPENFLPINLPVNGLIYRFAPAEVISVNETANAEFNLFPSVTSEAINVRFSQAGNHALVIRDISGREVMRQQTTGSQSMFDVSSLPSGAYFVQTTLNGKLAVARFIKQ